LMFDEDDVRVCLIGMRTLPDVVQRLFFNEGFKKFANGMREGARAKLEQGSMSPERMEKLVFATDNEIWPIYEQLAKLNGITPKRDS
jgi:hypothetical protein